MYDEIASPIAVAAFRSLLDPVALAEVVGVAYGLTDVRCRLIKAMLRDVYRVDARQGPAALIVYRHGRRMVDEIGAELDLLDDLAARGPDLGLFVAPALRAVSGARIVALAAPEGVRHAVLFPFVAGEQLARRPPPELAREYGRTIARLHTLTDDGPTSLSAQARWPVDVDLLVDDALVQIAVVLRDRPAVLAEFQRLAYLLRRRLDSLPRAAPGYGLIHGDAIPTNVLVGPDGRLTPIDFDFCGLGWRAFDVATFLHATQDDDVPPSGELPFLAGYQEVRPLAAWVLDALPVLAAARDLFSLGNWRWRLDEWGTSALPSDLVTRRLDRFGQVVGLFC